MTSAWAGECLKTTFEAMSEEGEEAAGGFGLRRGKTSPPVSCACAVALSYELAGVAAIHLTLVVARVRTVRRGSPHKGSPVFLRRAPERNTTTPKGLRSLPEETAKTLRGHRLKGSVGMPSRWEEESFRTLQQGCTEARARSREGSRALWGKRLARLRSGLAKCANQRRGRE